MSAGGQEKGCEGAAESRAKAGPGHHLRHNAEPCSAGAKAFPTQRGLGASAQARRRFPPAEEPPALPGLGAVHRSRCCGMRNGEL